MGVDIKGLSRVWVIGQFATLKEYELFLFILAFKLLDSLSLVRRVSQLFGRCGRDGKQAEATLFTASDKSIFRCDASMAQFCAARSCLRLLHARYFAPTMSLEDIMSTPVSVQRDPRCCSFCVQSLAHNDKCA